MIRTTAEWRLGDWGQREIRRQLEKAGWYVLPAYCIEDGGAPMLTGLLRKHVLPDLAVFRNGTARWNEVKTKGEAVWYQKAGEHRHGIDLPCWLAYREVEKETGIPGDLTILECRPEPCVLMAPFADLELWVQIEDRRMPGFTAGGAFWPRGVMTEWDVRDGLVLPDGLAIPRGTEHPWSRMATVGQQLSLHTTAHGAPTDEPPPPAPFDTDPDLNG